MPLLKDPNDKKYSFVWESPNIPEHTFEVVDFRGYEGLSRPYEFDILLVSESANIDLTGAWDEPAHLIIHRDNDDDVYVNGVLAQFEQLHHYTAGEQNFVFYRALLVPKLWWLSLTNQNKVYLNNKGFCEISNNVLIMDIIQSALLDGGFHTDNFSFLLDIDGFPGDISRIKYPFFDCVFQYGESHLNFVSRWAEREGIYYYFQQVVDRTLTPPKNFEKVVFTNKSHFHSILPHLIQTGGTDTHLTYNQDTPDEAIKSFTCRQQRLPGSVRIKDYNYESPSVSVSGTANTDGTNRGTDGKGEVYLYGEHVRTHEEGTRLAGIRFEELLCKKEQYYGDSNIPFMVPGYLFKLDGHYRSDFNWSESNPKQYLITEVTHEGNHRGFLNTAIHSAFTQDELTKSVYQNSFTVIPGDVQYRPERKTQKPRIHGTIHAHIDTPAGSGEYAHLDAQGRYKVRLPFDLDYDDTTAQTDATKTHKKGGASAYIRMMQPHAGKPVSGGKNHGFHFPLRQGTEVLLTFIDGDPDRPVIAGAVANPESKSPVTGGNNAVTPPVLPNNKLSIIRDRSGNEIVFDATEGQEYISMWSPNCSSAFEVGRGGIVSTTEGDNHERKIGNYYETGAGNKFEAYAGNIWEVYAGCSLKAMFGIDSALNFVGKQEALIGYDAGFHWGPEFKYHKGPTIEKSDADRTSLADQDNIISAKKITSIVGGAASDSTSIVNLKNDKITITVGSNKNPDATEEEMGLLKSKITKTAIGFSVGTLAVAALMSGLHATGMTSEDKETAGGILGTAEGLMMAVNLFLMIKWSNALKENIKHVSHFDDSHDKVESIIELHKDNGIMMGVWPDLTGAEVAIINNPALPPIQRDIPNEKKSGNAIMPAPRDSDADKFRINKDTQRSIIEMKKNGEILINSNPKTQPPPNPDDYKKILICTGPTDNPDSKIETLHHSIELNSKTTGPDGNSIIKMENGGITITSNKPITIRSSKPIKFEQQAHQDKGIIIQENGDIHIGKANKFYDRAGDRWNIG